MLAGSNGVTIGNTLDSTTSVRLRNVTASPVSAR
jgi:hypothetical protein